MKITVRCFFIPADVTFDLDDVKMETNFYNNDKGLILAFKGNGTISVDKQHYLAEKAKNHTV
jgi:uncharacterized membrane protein